MRRCTTLLIVSAMLCITAQPASAVVGDLDPSFGDGGVALSPGTNFVGLAMALQSDGKIVMAGYSNLTDDLVLIRFDEDGTVDTTFDGDGIVSTAVGLGAVPQDLLVQPDGKIVVVGWAIGGDILIARYLSDGSLDADFGTAGVNLLDLGGDDYAYGAILQPSGKIVVAGQTAGGDSDLLIARIDPDGTLDTTFGEDAGWTTLDAGGWDYANAIVTQGRPSRRGPLGGAIVIAGTTGEGDVVFARFSRDGITDATFGDDGFSVISEPATQEGLALTSSRRGVLTITGYSGNSALISRYRPNGAPDTRFGDGGTVLTERYDGLTGQDVVLVRRGKTIVSGIATVGGEWRIFVARYDVRGELDPTFGDDGIVIADPGDLSTASEVWVDRSERIYTAGWTAFASEAHFALIRYLGRSAPSGRR